MKFTPPLRVQEGLGLGPSVRLPCCVVTLLLLLACFVLIFMASSCHFHNVAFDTFPLGSTAHKTEYTNKNHTSHSHSTLSYNMMGVRLGIASFPPTFGYHFVSPSHFPKSPPSILRFSVKCFRKWHLLLTQRQLSAGTRRPFILLPFFRWAAKTWTCWGGKYSVMIKMVLFVVT